MMRGRSFRTLLKARLMVDVMEGKAAQPKALLVGGPAVRGAQ